MTLKLVRIIARGVDNLPTNFGVSGTFVEYFFLFPLVQKVSKN